MLITEDIVKKIKELSTLIESKGVQPSDLAEAIFDDDYKSINVVRGDNDIQVVVTFLDNEYSGIVNKIKYHYNLKKVLQKIDQKIGAGKYKEQWSRAKTVDVRVRELAFLLGQLNSQSRVQEFIDLLPSEEAKELKGKLRLVA